MGSNLMRVTIKQTPNYSKLYRISININLQVSNHRISHKSYSAD